MNSPRFLSLIERLQSAKRTWRVVSQATGVPYSTLTKVAQGKTRNPRVSTVEALERYFEGSSGG
jgi:predicted transcriptional regulator